MKKMSMTCLLIGLFCLNNHAQDRKTLTTAILKDKIRGGWAGQTIGVTFGGPYEFRFCGSFIQDYQPLLWYDGYVKKTMLENPGLYDDLYMDLTFVDVFDKYGLDAPVDSFANEYAHAGYVLWHANQAARYNILNGIKPPASGNWVNNPHADDIDYEIESDYAGLMSPGMPNTASAISDKIGHIMTYGDGWYGGVYIGAMYSLAFVSDDVEHIVNEALKVIPSNTTYHRCISDVIRWHKLYPNDWRQTWFEIQQKWSEDISCPEGIYQTFDIDAKLNSAYVVMGLLYGNGDFSRSLEVATRSGQDAGCNPSSVGGILGAVLGYDHIPAYWKQGLKEAEDINFKYTTISLNKVYSMGYDQALKNILRNGGSILNDRIVLPPQIPLAVRFEQCFAGLYPSSRITFDHNDLVEKSFDFEGSGIVIRGGPFKKNQDGKDITCAAAFYVDDRPAKIIQLPTDYMVRRETMFWDYQLRPGKHHITIRVLHPQAGYGISTNDYIVYTDHKPVKSENR